MKTEYEYIRFVLIPEREIKKTKLYHVYNNKGGPPIGLIKWYGSWRQYCFFPATQTIYSKGCLLDIINFIEQLNKERADVKNNSNGIR